MCGGGGGGGSNPEKEARRAQDAAEVQDRLDNAGRQGYEPLATPASTNKLTNRLKITGLTRKQQGVPMRGSQQTRIPGLTK